MNNFCSKICENSFDCNNNDENNSICKLFYVSNKYRVLMNFCFKDDFIEYKGSCNFDDNSSTPLCPENSNCEANLIQLEKNSDSVEYNCLKYNPLKKGKNEQCLSSGDCLNHLCKYQNEIISDVCKLDLESRNHYCVGTRNICFENNDCFSKYNIFGRCSVLNIGDECLEDRKCGNSGFCDETCKLFCKTNGDCLSKKCSYEFDIYERHQYLFTDYSFNIGICKKEF